MIDALRERAEAFLSNESYEAITAKRTEARQRANDLRLKIDELQRALDKTKGQ